MAACFNIARGKCQKMMQTVRFPLRVMFLRPASTETESLAEDPELDVREVERKIEKMRDCSGLSLKQRMRHHGKMGVMPIKRRMKSFKSTDRKIFRRLYAEYGVESGINAGIMFPSKAELEDLIDVEKNWTQSFQQMKKNIEENKAAEELAARLRDEKIDKAMEKMPQLVKQYQNKMKQGQEAERRKDNTESLLEEFQETYGFSVTPDSRKFKYFRRMKTEESKVSKEKQKKEEKKKTGMQSLKTILEEQVKPDSSS